jgi:hypothetical protein
MRVVGEKQISTTERAELPAIETEIATDGTQINRIN